jgi:hypothetical protein
MRERSDLVARKKSKKARREKTEGDSPALPPPDDPMGRHAQDADVSDREAARLRLEAILQTRSMPETNGEPEKPDGSSQRE